MFPKEKRSGITWDFFIGWMPWVPLLSSKQQLKKHWRGQANASQPGCTSNFQDYSFGWTQIL